MLMAFLEHVGSSRSDDGPFIHGIPMSSDIRTKLQ
jgi:hypothetical protein